MILKKLIFKDYNIISSSTEKLQKTNTKRPILRVNFSRNLSPLLPLAITLKRRAQKSKKKPKALINLSLPRIIP